MLKSKLALFISDFRESPVAKRTCMLRYIYVGGILCHMVESPNLAVLIQVHLSFYFYQLLDIKQE